MAADTFVNQVQRVGTDTGGLAPGQSAVLFDATQFDIADAPDTISTAADGGTITGITFVTIKGAILDQDNFLSRAISTGGTLTDGGGTVQFFGFRATKAVTVGAISLTMMGGAWTGHATQYWRFGVKKNGSGAATKDLSTAGTGTIAQYATATLFASGFFTAVAGDVFLFEFSPISSPADLALAEITIDLAQA